jgi:hypothetical protein
VKSPYGSIRPPKGPDIADHVAVARAERAACDLHSGAIDLRNVVTLPMAIQHDARPAEGVGQNAVRPCFRIAPLDRQHALGLRQVPRLSAIALLQARDHQLCAHGAIAQQRARSNHMV